MTIVCEILPGGRSVRLIKDLIVRDDDGTTIRVPAGFVSDFASVPRIFWRVAPPWGPYSEAAVVHDWLYRTGYPRAEADATFRRLMARAGVRFPLRWAMWVAVRAFGWMHWRRVGVAVAAVLCLSSARDYISASELAPAFPGRGQACRGFDGAPNRAKNSERSPTRRNFFLAGGGVSRRALILLEIGVKKN